MQRQTTMTLLSSKKAFAAVVVGVLLISTIGAGVESGESSTEQDAKTEYESIVIFRNDDVQPYYRTEAQRKVDQVFIDEQVPVTEAVIPAPGSEPVSPNQSFCKYLTDQKRQHSDLFEYALHGYNHQVETEFYIGPGQHYVGNAKSEFVGVAASKQRKKIERGTRTLEACVGEEPEVFVPPFGTYSDETVRIAEQEGYRAISGGGWYTKHYYNRSQDDYPFYTDGLLHVPRSGEFVENWTTGEFLTLDALKNRFDEAYENHNVYVQMIHSPLFTDEQRLQRLRDFIRYVNNHEGVRFMTLGEFARSYESGRLEKVEDGWLYEPKSEPDPGETESDNRSFDSENEAKDAVGAGRS